MQSFVVAATALIFAMLSITNGYPLQDNPQDDDSDMYLEPEKSETRIDDPQESQNNFYPSFGPFQNPPLGHSRPFYYQPEAAYSHRPSSSFPNQQVAYDSPRYSGYKDDGFRAAANSDSHGILGSGNFGVIKGGTFYDKESGGGGGGGDTRNYDRDFSGYFGNSHAAPYYFGGTADGGGGGVPNPRPHQHEQFENFRDFADINTPSNPAYSQYVVVYVNKNATKQEEAKPTASRPKNIIESLALLDLEGPSTPATTDELVEDIEVPSKKPSKSKAKLAKLLPEKKYKYPKAPKSAETLLDPHEEPLLALS